MSNAERESNQPVMGGTGTSGPGGVRLGTTPRPEVPASPSGTPSNIVFVLTGSIAAFKACEVISQLAQRGHRVRTVATTSALRFIGPATLEGLTGQPVASDLFAAGTALDHINLTRWADLVIVCPATAHTLNRFAAGLADDLAGALFLAHDRTKPFLVAPAMNPAMWSHPATVAAVGRLTEWGVRVLPVAAGWTACGEVGAGRLIEPRQILAAVESALARPTRRLRILITSGGTSEPIDDVRVLTNTSTGRTGAIIATHFSRRGHEVTLLRARTAQAADGACAEEVFSTFAELDAALGRLLAGTRFDAVIHAAAVGDFGVAAVEVDGTTLPPGAPKIESGSAPVLRLHRHAKLLPQLRARSAPGHPIIVAFKLTSRAAPDGIDAAVTTLLASGHADYVVHNDLAARDAAGELPATIFAADGTAPVPCPTRAAVAGQLEALLVARPAVSPSPS
jgi:phosphopantothenoylcysteine decarboxylase/phosphopantothenate--cysteine ligase